MKKLRYFLISLFIVVLFLSCDPETCYYYKIRNKSIAIIDVLVYENEGNLRDGQSAIGLLMNDSYNLSEIYCGRGAGGAPFQSRNKTDSIVVIFNDTIKAVIFNSEMEDLSNNIFGSKSPIFFDAWHSVRMKKEKDYYEYEFTNWHYQKALEAYGYSIE